MEQTTLFAIAPQSSPTIFARHETFHPRFGWLKKGFDQAVRDPGVFLADDATVKLGVGKNMVRSIRYWCRAFKLLSSEDTPTPFGTLLLGESGWDCYLEDPASLWLLHWKLLESPCYATAWQLIFNQLRANEFTQEDLFYHLQECAQGLSGKTADSSLKKDVNCLLRMYVRQPQKQKAIAEDSLDCPFTALGLMHTAGLSHRYGFRIGYKPTLPPAIITYACLLHAQRTSTTARTIPLANLLYDPGSPGLIFKLTEQDICSAIESVGREFNALGLSDAAGKLQFSFNQDPHELADRVLQTYYLL
jgi:hypothetical protein